MSKMPETNIALLKRLMEFCPTGAISQFFIIDAVLKQAQMVNTAEKPENWNSFVAWEAWKETAQYIQHEIENRR